ncbi:Ig-like domain-containing domain [Marivirga tractuosa]|uniref:Ig-like domain-containing domain n=1 Tax=Marivirga tractuosa TaxID=1006 RepID=UPI0035CF810E
MIRKLLSLSIIIIIYACATVQSPTGGEKDEKAPVLYESNPKNQSINFKGKEIKLFFNEWMKLEQLDNELIITPREDIEFEASLKKQELIITLEEKLKDSTTYTFNFRKALKDITEGNLWEDPIIAFSTGPFLDSLEVSGTVLDIKNNSKQEGFLVGLYSNEYDTANMRQGKPVYFTTTDKEGNYKMENLKAGSYKLYTFKDSNDNLINNPQSEPFGFHSEVIELYDSIGNINMNTYSRNEDTLKLKKFSPVGKDFTIQYNKGLQSYSILNPKDSNQFIYANDIEKSKHLKIYKENFPKHGYDTDSTLLIVNVSDSIGNERSNSVYFKLRESRLSNDSIQITGKPNAKITSGNQEFNIEFSKPVHTINYDSIELRIDTIPIYKFTDEDLVLSKNRKQIKINSLIDKDEIQNITDSLSELKSKLSTDSLKNNRTDSTTVSDSIKTQDNELEEPNPTIGRDSRSGTSSQNGSMKLQLYLGKAAFLGIEKDSTKATSISFSFMKAENYGIIKGKVIDPAFPFVIELLNDKYEVIDTLINEKEFQFNYVDPGDYRLRLLKDENSNQKWDAGDPFLLEPEEEYIYLNELITVKANWEVIDKNFNFSVDNEVDNGEEDEDL